MHGFHGDVILRKVKDLPQGAKKQNRKSGCVVLAEGEVTGHAHRIKDECELYEKDGVLFLVNENKVTVTHEEHKATVILPGVWEIGIAKEYDFLTEETRNVAD